ncbi:glucose-1-phosphate adenylyltransferase family protein [Desulfobulbus oligotrophicus]|jgi:glucose-1-phosphate adenylyltransferase|uniref:Glucose-1-phosphate adenylyltransferase n=1 Tax=Desulfobulbus oligotrophicus TaxID=1909699 RepID=A0A7T5VBD8_9BACT|nr:sugar phosphate nucleotidyltransferase [Desulfobulbus oligotrophicus]MDY0390472.1 sugar phosphate nucleotidyltransferase [Desulfobulbus oligotrophicus]QQG64765.1 glucose-1-phosphate adenylyltransferase [Desulfobulbus oligotrophicus]
MRESGDALVLLLAGGIGSRLNLLVGRRAKPAVPFGGIYRIIDFSLSNVMNSGLTRVGVLTQYKPLSLMAHIGDGAAWDFTGRTRGIKILPPRTGEKDADWYQGTADAIRQNIDFILANPSEQVVILSGDHIYRMDFDAMLSYHEHKRADITIGMMVVPKKDIHQFGAGIIDNENRIIDWEEKPKVPRTNLASMGIYVFDTAYLLRTLARDRQEVDFGMDIIPRAINEDRVYAYPFYGYWRDVGTIQSYWETNMDIIREDSEFSPEEWEIRPNPEYGDHPMDRAPARFLSGSKVSSSLISAGCVIEGTVTNSVLSPGVWVGKDAVVSNSVVFDDCVIEKNAVVDLAILDKRVRVEAGAVIGYGDNLTVVNRTYPKHLYTGITLIGKEARIAQDMRIGRNCTVSFGYHEESFNGSKVLADGQSA